MRTLIPLDQVISVRSCYCKRFPKKLTCDCIEQEYSKTSEGGHPLTARNSDQKRDSILEGEHIFSREGSTDSGSSTNSSDDTLSPSQSISSENNNSKENSGKKKYKVSLKSRRKNVQAVRVYYAVPVGKFQWKVACLHLTVPYDDNHEQDNDSDGEHSQRSSSMSSSSPSIPLSASKTLGNQVLGWIDDVSKLLEGEPNFLLLFRNLYSIS